MASRVVARLRLGRGGRKRSKEVRGEERILQRQRRSTQGANRRRQGGLCGERPHLSHQFARLLLRAQESRSGWPLSKARRSHLADQRRDLKTRSGLRIDYLPGGLSL